MKKVHSNATTLSCHIYTTDQLNPPPTLDPYSPPTTPQSPCKLHKPYFIHFKMHTSLSHLSTLQLEVLKLAPTDQATFTLSTLLHSLRLLVQSISLIQVPQHWISLAFLGSHLSLIALLWRPTCMRNKNKQTRHEMVSHHC